jgi:TolA-binding protein
MQEVREIPPPPATVKPPPTPASAAPEPSPSARGTLAAEVAALDSARQALGAGNASRTLELLNGYEARFPDAGMLPEALYLRLEAFTLEGDQSNAEAIARRILRVYPSSPHAARARAVLGASK